MLLKLVKDATTIASGVYALSVVGFLVTRALLGDRLALLALAADFTPLLFVPLIVLIPLALILQGRAALLILLVPLGIGAVLIGRWYVPKNLPPPDDRAFTVTQFNVLFSNPNIDAAIERATADADIVILEELPPAYLNGVEAVRARFPYQRSIASPNNAILSRYPFDPSSSGIFPAVVQIGGQAVAVYAVHLPLPLDPHVGEGNLSMLRHYDPAVRDVRMIPLLDALQNETRPFIVAGDFNMSEYATMYPRLAALMTDSYREAGSGLGFSWSLKQPIPMVRIDYVWHSAQFRAVRASVDLTPTGSDHAPLSVMLDWR